MSDIYLGKIIAFIKGMMKQAQIDGSILGIEVADNLPEVGKENIFYLVPKEEGTANNMFDEYIYKNNTWELVGMAGIDYTLPIATKDTLGGIKVGNGLKADDTGVLNNDFYKVKLDPNGQIETVSGFANLLEFLGIDPEETCMKTFVCNYVLDEPVDGISVMLDTFLCTHYPTESSTYSILKIVQLNELNGMRVTCQYTYNKN
jgi:hypothetical protein